MLHALHYDVAFFNKGHSRHPGTSSGHYAFAALTPKGREKLESAPVGKWETDYLSVSTDDEAEDIMDHILTLEVHIDY
ncbi:hypothetical protein [Methylobacterium sp.]|uniref:hypothetical protein n=1 Tax=Methylobacterium sp. TaxID=409 RepID=UPI003B000280